MTKESKNNKTIPRYQLGKSPALPAMHGPLATAKEWVWCLFSVKHAETTWLRIAEDVERRTFRRIERFLFIILGALIALSVVIVNRYMFFHDMTVYEYKDATVYVKPK